MVGPLHQELLSADGKRPDLTADRPDSAASLPSFKKTKTEERADRIEALAATLGLPGALSGTVEPTPFGPLASTP